MTFSLVGRCARTGRFGAVVTSSSPAVAARCAWARAGVGAACTQNVTDPALGPRLLDALSAGATATEALAEVVAGASYAEYRQLTVIDQAGAVASHSGVHTLGTHHTVEATDCLAAGNLLTTPEVPEEMVRAFVADPAADLGDRLLAALSAGEEAGGEEGPVHSCGMVIVDKAPWPVTDLRVDWSDSPMGDLERAWKIWAPQAADYVTRALDPTAAPSYGVPGDE
ncbi:DUF1028 domain-containing protein [Streptomyces cavernicola]|uniref:DUF1028 domain-containing protein n=1 Tax=Streptomyces cavernicola TaxID=3043613 RepID=A0ABT6S7K8_9ACTN|nr:DUF1028 domain-containing protein [Streptomyces sp. B-S-A6]MDI3403301.1 DUF1028 domain-containing protein [Streptomyces sp. B-S-A6]